MHKLKSQSAKRKVKAQSLKLSVLSFSFALFAFSFTLTSFAKDKIVAVVNNDCITEKDVNDFVNFIRLRLSREYRGEALEKKIAEIKPDLLKSLIEDRLILQEARKNDSKVEIRPKAWVSIMPDENRVKARINEMKKYYPSETQFLDDLAKQGLTLSDIENRIREQLLMTSIVDFSVKDKIKINPEEVNAYYNSNKDKFLLPEERQFSVITLENQDQASSFSYNLRAGGKLEDLAARYPITVSNLSILRGEELRKELKDAMMNLGLGQVSNPIQLDNKYYVFRLDNIMPGRQESLAESQNKIYNLLLESKMRKGLEDWLNELKNKSYIKISQN